MTDALPGGLSAAGQRAAAGPTQLVLPFVPYIAISVVHVAFIVLDNPLAGPTKLLLMPLLAVGILWAAAGIRPWPGRALSLLLLGVLFSWLGDGSSTFFPMFKDEVPMMLACFGIAHVCYVLLMWSGRGLARGGFPKWALGYVAAYVLLIALLVPHTGDLTIPVVFYGALLVATAAFAARCGGVIAWGGFWFLASDAILSFRIFTPDAMPDWTSGAVMLTYTLGQGLIAAGVVRALASRSAAPASSG